MNFFNMGPGEMILILVVALIVFGPGKLPEMGRSLGRGIAEFRRATSELSKELTGTVNEVNDAPAEPAPATEADTKACPRCSTTNPADNLYCSECGAWLAGDNPALAGATAIACPQCNALNPAGNKFCRACGSRLPAEQAETAAVAASYYPLAVPDVPQLPAPTEAGTQAAATEAVSTEAQQAEGEAAPTTAVAELPEAQATALLDLPEIDYGTTAEPERANGAKAGEPRAAEVAALAEAHEAAGDAAQVPAAAAEQESAPLATEAAAAATADEETPPRDEDEPTAKAALVGAGTTSQPA